MDILICLISTALFLSALYVLLIMGRKGHSGLEKLKGWNYAHRGLHGNGIPENSMQAFRLALEKGYGIELDVHLMRDGNLAVIHDASLKRTAGADVLIEDLSAEDLAHYYLEGTQEKIPLFREVLDLYAGKAPLIVELKAEKGNAAALTDATCKMLDDYDGAYCLESFDPRCILWLRKNRPELIRGQLSENWLRSTLRLPWILKLILTFHLENVFLYPDFISYKFEHRRTFGTDLCRKIWGVQGVTWTLKTQKELDEAVKEGWIPIFEGFEP